MPANADQFFDEYDDVSERVNRSHHRDFTTLLRRWFACLEEAPKPISDRVRWLETLVSWNEVETNVLKPGSGMGSGQMDWPEDRERRLSARLALFRHLSREQEDGGWRFASGYFSGRNPDAVLSGLTERVFDDHSSELRRYIQRNLDVPLISEDQWAPAADRIVSIKHNSDIYQQVIEAAEELKATLVGTNLFDPETSERVESEISAGQTLLKSRTVRLAALTALFVPTLRWLADAFAGTAVGMAAQTLFEHLIAMIPSLV
ncbi:MAG: hypothetical protein E5Y34_12995 [Mesorhizobium sp.]|uniref:hypothetical protein n=2 Tax=unclassified Mesorhizobium TaxID=325217 RepID=UPI001210C040|nr:hypothetical protein [Mesorhizobium sp.]TIN00224.1 MAG: hypothetical protein E5Y34_12995 [Mesorhizobium sp.]